MPNRAHRQQVPALPFPCSLGSQSFFIYLQLSTVAGADKRLQLSCEGPSIPQPGPHVMIVKCKAKHMAFHSTDAWKPQRMSSIEFLISTMTNMHTQLSGKHPFPPHMCYDGLQRGNYVNDIKHKKLLQHVG